MKYRVLIYVRNDVVGQRTLLVAKLTKIERYPGLGATGMTDRIVCRLKYLNICLVHNAQINFRPI